MVGRTLSHYRLLEQLGAGGMGEVYLAEDLDLGRRVALKVLPVEFTADAEHLARFRREARTLASLNHPNIVTIHEVGQSNGTHFLVMELVEGSTLSTSIRRGGTTPERLLEFAVPLAAALAAAHDRGIVHRDLKPANLMINDEGQIKILDFGLAKLRRDAGGSEQTEAMTQSLTADGRILGTVPYMAPEQVRGETADPRTDIFALGVLLYELATGERPFSGDTSVDLVSAILRDTPRQLDEVRKDLPHHLARVVRRCLEKDPERRYQSVKDVGNDLQDLQLELKDGAQRRAACDRPQQTARAATRHIVGGGAILALLVVASLLAFFGWRGGHPAGAIPGQRPEIRSLAVLPFDNQMNDPEQSYFVDGLHEALIMDLAKITALRVISRTSAMQYRETGKTLPEIARELDVDVLVEGSVLRDENRVRIGAKLIHGETDEHLWAASYDRDLTNVLALLSEVARAIAAEIEVTVTPEQERRLSSSPAVDREIQELFLKANFFMNRLTGSDFQQAEELYGQVVALDPGFAPAYGHLALTHVVMGIFGYRSPELAAQGAEAAARKGLELDPDLASAHSALGWVELRFRWNWSAAAAALRHALELNPNDLVARHGLADYLLLQGDIDGSVQQVRLGRAHDPLSPLAVGPLVAHLVLARRYDEAIAEGEEALQLFPNLGWLHKFMGWAYWYQSDHEAALDHFRLPVRPTGRKGWVEALERGLAEGGPRAAWLALGDYYADESLASPAEAAGAYAAAGEAELAFEWLEKALAQRDPGLLHQLCQPNFDPLRPDPRFEALLAGLGIHPSVVG